MSDYSFLKTGHNLVEPPKKFTEQEQENIMIIVVNQRKYFLWYLKSYSFCAVLG